MFLFLFFFFLFTSTIEWDAEWTGPQVIVEVSEKASSANGTNMEGNVQYKLKCLMLRAIFGNIGNA